jgi:hypothetical protein
MFCPLPIIVQILHKCSEPDLFSLSPFCVSLLMASEWEIAFFWPIASWHLLYIAIHKRMRIYKIPPQTYFTWGLLTWALASGCPARFSLFYVSALTYTHNRCREKSLDQTYLLNLWTIGAINRTSGQPQVKLSLLQSIYLKIRPLHKRIKSSAAGSP